MHALCDCESCNVYSNRPHKLEAVLRTFKHTSDPVDLLATPPRITCVSPTYFSTCSSTFRRTSTWTLGSLLLSYELLEAPDRISDISMTTKHALPQNKRPLVFTAQHIHVPALKIEHWAPLWTSTIFLSIVSHSAQCAVNVASS